MCGRSIWIEQVDKLLIHCSFKFSSGWARFFKVQDGLWILGQNKLEIAFFVVTSFSDIPLCCLCVGHHFVCNCCAMGQHFYAMNLDRAKPTSAKNFD